MPGVDHSYIDADGIDGVKIGQIFVTNRVVRGLGNNGEGRVALTGADDLPKTTRNK